ncbi:MAG: transposase, partial [Bacilli bacterium]|nr:transposase [Bacilli bacterium]
SNYILGLEVFKKYYHPSLVLNKNQSEFVEEIDEIAKKLGHRSAGKTLANKIYNLAKSTISPRPDNEYSQLACTSCIDILILTIKTSDTIISEMDKLARELPEYEIIKEFPGIGERLTCKIIAEVGDIRKFKNAGSLIAYAGLDAPPYQSGQFEAKIRHISKRGNKYLRKIGYEIIRSITMVCSAGVELYDYVLKKQEEGKPKKVAKIAGLNKFLRMYYGRVKAIYKKLEEN